MYTSNRGVTTAALIDALGGQSVVTSIIGPAKMAELTSVCVDTPPLGNSGDPCTAASIGGGLKIYFSIPLFGVNGTTFALGQDVALGFGYIHTTATGPSHCIFTTDLKLYINTKPDGCNVNGNVDTTTPFPVTSTVCDLSHPSTPEDVATAPSGVTFTCLQFSHPFNSFPAEETLMNVLQSTGGGAQARLNEFLSFACPSPPCNFMCMSNYETSRQIVCIDTLPPLTKQYLMSDLNVNQPFDIILAAEASPARLLDPTTNFKVSELHNKASSVYQPCFNGATADLAGSIYVFYHPCEGNSHNNGTTILSCPQ